MAFNGDIGQVLGSSASTDYDKAEAAKNSLQEHVEKDSATVLWVFF